MVRSMEGEGQLKRLGWLLPLRLASYVILFTVVVLRLDYPSYLHLPFVTYSVLTLGFAVLLAVSDRQKFQLLSSIVIGLQFVLEIIVESAIIYATGGVNSPFSALFLLTIVSVALTYHLVGTLMVASFVSISYTFIIWLGLAGTDGVLPFHRVLSTVFSSQDSVFYSIFLHILIFYLVAFISGYLAERLKARDRQLADTSRELRKARLETDDILRHLNSGLLTIDAGGCIVFFNRAAERILDYREEDVKGMRCDEVFAERMPNLASALMNDLATRVQHPRKEIEILNADRTSIPLGLSTSPLTEDGGMLRGLIAIFSDLTDAKLLEGKVRAADRLAAVGELSASIAHEIRNPLAAISGSVEVLDGELQLKGENSRLMQLIVKESHRLSRILSEFLLYAKIDRPIYNKVELCHLVNEVIRILYHQPSFHENMKINFEADESIIYVVGDEDLIKQLLLNLAVNACEAFEVKGDQLTFRIAADPADGAVKLYVQDNGPGIPTENMKRIYEPFYSTKKQGTGLGLAIVHRVCVVLQLDISINSQLDEGTTFMIEFETYKSDKINIPAVESETGTPLSEMA